MVRFSYALTALCAVAAGTGDAAALEARTLDCSFATACMDQMACIEAPADNIDFFTVKVSADGAGTVIPRHGTLWEARFADHQGTLVGSGAQPEAALLFTLMPNGTARLTFHGIIVAATITHFGTCADTE